MGAGNKVHANSKLLIVLVQRRQHSDSKVSIGAQNLCPIHRGVDGSLTQHSLSCSSLWCKRCFDDSKPSPSLQAKYERKVAWERGWSALLERKMQRRVTEVGSQPYSCRHNNLASYGSAGAADTNRHLRRGELWERHHKTVVAAFMCDGWSICITLGICSQLHGLRRSSKQSGSGMRRVRLWSPCSRRWAACLLYVLPVEFCTACAPLSTDMWRCALSCAKAAWHSCMIPECVHDCQAPSCAQKSFQ